MYLLRYTSFDCVQPGKRDRPSRKRVRRRYSERVNEENKTITTVIVLLNPAGEYNIIFYRLKCIEWSQDGDGGD